MTAMLVAAFIAGLAGSAHCFGMCGGMAGALGLRARQISSSSAHATAHALLYHMGRIGGYASVGAAFGALGHSAHWALDLTRFDNALRVVAGAITVLVGVRVLSRWNVFAPLERLGAKAWMKLQPVTRRMISNRHSLATLATGLVWGWLPCGLVYSIALMALTTDGAAAGAAVMVAFGLGTLPALLATSLAAGAARQRLLQRAGFRTATGAALIVFGLWMMIAAHLPATHASHHSAAVVAHSL